MICEQAAGFHLVSTAPSRRHVLCGAMAVGLLAMLGTSSLHKYPTSQQGISMARVQIGFNLGCVATVGTLYFVSDSDLPDLVFLLLIALMCTSLVVINLVDEALNLNMVNVEMKIEPGEDATCSIGLLSGRRDMELCGEGVVEGLDIDQLVQILHRRKACGARISIAELNTIAEQSCI